jgi:predicted small secreted protein
MKRLQTIITLLLTAFTVAACSNEDENPVDGAGTDLDASVAMDGSEEVNTGIDDAGGQCFLQDDGTCGPSTCPSSDNPGCQSMVGSRYDEVRNCIVPGEITFACIPSCGYPGATVACYLTSLVDGGSEVFRTAQTYSTSGLPTGIEGCSHELSDSVLDAVACE